jgi:hypothetical protein
MSSSGILWNAKERVAGNLMRGTMDQRDVNVDIVQLRRVITASREVLYVNVAARIQHPLSVSAVIPREPPTRRPVRSIPRLL